MKQQVVFSESMVVSFCQATADDNPIHDPNYMYAQNKGVVVPGMLLFSTIINHLYQRTQECYNYYRLIFGNVICANEKVDLGYTPNLEKPEHKYLFAINGHDSFSTKLERSVAIKNGKGLNLLPNGIDRRLSYCSSQLETFRKLTNSVNHSLADFLFTIAYASAALFKSIREPLTEVEEEINRLLDKTVNPDQVSPFYQTLEIYRTRFDSELSNEGTIDYNIRFEREKQNKVYVAHVVCSQNTKVLYHSIYKLVAIPDKLIMRMVKGVEQIAVEPHI